MRSLRIGASRHSVLGMLGLNLTSLCALSVLLATSVVHALDGKTYVWKLSTEPRPSAAN